MDTLQHLQSDLTWWKNLQLYWAPGAGVLLTAIGLIIVYAINFKVDSIEKAINNYWLSAEGVIIQADELIEDMKNFMEDTRRERNQMSNPITPDNANLPQHTLQSIWNDYSKRLSENFLRAQTKYNERFKTKAQVFRGKLQKYLPQDFRRGEMDFTYSNPVNEHSYEQIIDDLESMTFYLKDHMPTK